MATKIFNPPPWLETHGEPQVPGNKLFLILYVCDGEPYFSTVHVWCDKSEEHLRTMLCVDNTCDEAELDELLSIIPIGEII